MNLSAEFNATTGLTLTTYDIKTCTLEYETCYREAQFLQEF